MHTTHLSRRQSLIAWTLCCLLAGGVFLVYALTSLAVGHGQYVMPLDDVYIHFQYAKQMALGQPYIYNPGQPATSGATSFLYPFVLAFGYGIGFQGLNLGVWAMGIGALALAGSAYLMVLLARALNAPYWLALAGAVVFALTGAISWHFMSGMETGLTILFTLLTLYQFMRRDARGLGFSAFLLGLVRPEGSLLVVIGTVLAYIGLHGMKNRRWLLLPLLALGIQPLVNLLFTGSMMATGNQAKSIFGMIPFYWDVVISRILDNFLRMWTEFATGISPREGAYLPLGVSLLALFGWLRLAWRRETRLIALLLLGWLLAGTAAVSTLDPAFWHFKRYQMPLLALLFPLALWGAGWILNRQNPTKTMYVSSAVGVSVVFVLGAALWTGANFLRYYALNVSYVYSQPLQMARWLDTNTPPDATVAVHDVGMMRYMGNRTTIDMVGLTTPGAADAWRNGPGAVAEFLIDVRPDYVAAYTSARGLSYLAATGIYNYGHALVEFPVTVDMSANVALAAEVPEVVQGIYQPDWSDSTGQSFEMETFNSLDYLSYVGTELEIVDRVNVANLHSEALHSYIWFDNERLSGFPTEFYDQLSLSDRAQEFLTPTQDGGRLINGGERFVVASHPQQNLILVTRVHPLNAGTFDIYANGQYIDTNWIPAVPGQWMEAPTLIPAQFIVDTQTEIRIIPHIQNGYYMPYYHWVLQGTPRTVNLSTEMDWNQITSFQNGALSLFVLSENPIEFLSWYTPKSLFIQTWWQVQANPQGDYIFFAHLYQDVARPPVAQRDIRLLNGSTPLGNLILGAYGGAMVIDVSSIPPGQYQVAIGMYDAVTLQNLHPDYGGDELGRVFIGTIDIPEN